MSKPAARQLDICSGHGSYPPRAILQGSSSVNINGRRAARVFDLVDIHCQPIPPDCHLSNISSGSSTVYIGGQPAARIGDRIACTSVIASGSGNVFIG